MAVSELTRDLIESVSWRTLVRWLKKLREKGAAGLIDKRGKRADRDYSPLIEQDEEMHNLVRGMIFEYPHVRATHVRQAIVARMGRDRCPSERTISRFLSAWKQQNHNLFARICQPRRAPQQVPPGDGIGERARRAPQPGVGVRRHADRRDAGRRQAPRHHRRDGRLHAPPDAARQPDEQEHGRGHAARARRCCAGACPRR